LYRALRLAQQYVRKDLLKTVPRQSAVNMASFLKSLLTMG
jgi:hypothetical protein